MKKLFVLSLCLTLVIFTAVGVWAANQITIKYLNGATQTVNLNQSSTNIKVIEFGGDGANLSSSAFQGTWKTNWGEMEINVYGTTVTGSYPHDNGRINGTLFNNGQNIEGSWSEAPNYAPPDDGGRLVLELSKDGNSFSGKWYYGKDAAGGNWTGTRIK